MLTQAQITAEAISPALTDVQVMSLTLLVKRFPPYYNNLGLFPDLAGKLAAEVATPTVKTRALKAVLTQLGSLPAIVVESQGTRDEPAHFTTNDNWQELAFDVLNMFYDIPLSFANQNYALAHPFPQTDCDFLQIYRHNLRRI